MQDGEFLVEAVDFEVIGEGEGAHGYGFVLGVVVFVAVLFEGDRRIRVGQHLVGHAEMGVGEFLCRPGRSRRCRRGSRRLPGRRAGP